MSAPRYAIYFAPPPDTPIWRFGSQVLGYDAATGAAVTPYIPDGFDAATWADMTADPRLYGFHATLKAPFHLATKHDESDLRAALAAFARSVAAFRLGALSVTALPAGTPGRGFVAMTPQGSHAALQALEGGIVRHFDHFRAPLTGEDRARRRPERLTERQLTYLDTFGYPYVLEEFRFHMTLTGPVEQAHDVADLLADAAANMIGTVDIRIDQLCLFRQDAPGDRFRIIDRVPLHPA